VGLYAFSWVSLLEGRHKDFQISEEGRIVYGQVVRFIDEKIIPAEKIIADEAEGLRNGEEAPTMTALRAEAKSLGL
jgi:hypothetical protein